MEKPRSHLGLHHAAIFVHDMAAARHFYVDLLGFRVEWEPDLANVYLTSGTDNLALHQAEAPAEGTPQRGRPATLDHLGIIVAHSTDVQVWEGYLACANVPIVAKTKRHRDGATSCYVRDPSGLVVQILHHPGLHTHATAAREVPDGSAASECHHPEGLKE